MRPCFHVRTFLDILRAICSGHGYPAQRAANTSCPRSDRFGLRELRVSRHFSTFYGPSFQALDTQVTRRRPGTGRPSVEGDGPVRRPCPNQRNKSDRKENARQSQLCSMPASPSRRARLGASLALPKSACRGGYDEADRPAAAASPRELVLTTPTAAVETSNRLRTAGLAVTRETRASTPLDRGATALERFSIAWMTNPGTTQRHSKHPPLSPLPILFGTEFARSFM